MDENITGTESGMLPVKAAFCAHKQRQKAEQAERMLACRDAWYGLWRATRTRDAKHHESAYKQRQKAEQIMEEEKG